MMQLGCWVGGVSGWGSFGWWPRLRAWVGLLWVGGERESRRVQAEPRKEWRLWGGWKKRVLGRHCNNTNNNQSTLYGAAARPGRLEFAWTVLSIQSSPPPGV